MNGIDKLTQRISDDARAEAEQLLQKAREEAAAITADYAKKAEQAGAETLARGKAAAAQREERLASVAAMESRKAALAVKQEMIDKAFELTLEKLGRLPEAEYIDLLARLAVKASVSGEEEILLSADDKERVGAAVVAGANALKEGGKLTLSERTAPIQGGIVLKDGDVEINCAFETLIRLARHDMAGEVAGVLFQ